MRENPYPALRKHDFSRFLESAKKEGDLTTNLEVESDTVE
jgi:hypothetical protein